MIAFVRPCNSARPSCVGRDRRVPTVSVLAAITLFVVLHCLDLGRRALDAASRRCAWRCVGVLMATGISVDYPRAHGVLGAAGLAGRSVLGGTWCGTAAWWCVKVGRAACGCGVLIGRWSCGGELRTLCCATGGATEYRGGTWAGRGPRAIGSSRTMCRTMCRTMLGEVVPDGRG